MDLLGLAHEYHIRRRRNAHVRPALSRRNSAKRARAAMASGIDQQCVTDFAQNVPACQVPIGTERQQLMRYGTVGRVPFAEEEQRDVRAFNQFL